MTPANMAHMFWSCPHLQDYWTAIFKHLAEALNMKLTPIAELAISGVLTKPQTTRKNFKDFSSLCILIITLKNFVGMEVTVCPQSLPVA